MLYFTEMRPSSPDIYNANAEFERDYGADEYEEKIARLLKNARHRDGKEAASGEKQWEDALEALKKEDHYILVMVNQAFGTDSISGGGNRVRDFLIYSAVGICIVLWLVWKSWH
jgi:hypothetical protein